MTNPHLVILSEAKDLLAAREMLRCAQHDKFNFIIRASLLFRHSNFAIRIFAP